MDLEDEIQGMLKKKADGMYVPLSLGSQSNVTEYVTLDETPQYRERLIKFLLDNRCIVPTNAIHTILLCDLGTPCKPAVVHTFLSMVQIPSAQSPEGDPACTQLAPRSRNRGNTS
jgi:hypothetical protein